MDERYYCLGFSVFSEGIGPKRFQLLLDFFGSAKSAWYATEEELQNSGANIGKVIAEKFTSFKKQSSIEQYVKELEEKKIHFFTLADEGYPTSLRAVKNPPIVLYMKGNGQLFVERSRSENIRPSTLRQLVDRSGNNTIAIVGTRKITGYGREVTEQITETLVSAGYTIVSGLAFGVDATAHMTTIKSNGKTIAVLGCGVDCCSPREHQQLYDDIVESGGVIVSEYPLGAPSTKGSFPSRNRIIAGLSEAVVVTEGAEDSGALYTANEAFTIGRPVFAVPGPITSSLSKGPFYLIGKGAKLVTRVEDILKELRVDPSADGGELRIEKEKIKGDTEDEQRVIDLLQNEELQFDELVRNTGFDSANLGVLLSLMELKGIVKEEGGVFRLA